eukprot:scaffold11122_cov63-Phaeocystis_antarctica.AAC.2
MAERLILVTRRSPAAIQQVLAPLQLSPQRLSRSGERRRSVATASMPRDERHRKVRSRRRRARARATSRRLHRRPSAAAKAVACLGMRDGTQFSFIRLRHP